jgi:hypothetical protein
VLLIKGKGTFNTYFYIYSNWKKIIIVIKKE